MNARDRTQSGVFKATGREREEWFAVLDDWKAAGRPYREIADWLKTEHDLSNWWAQKLIVEYEQARGIRPPGVRRDGTFEVGASKTAAASVATVLDAFMDPKQRERWLPDATIEEKRPRKADSIRFDWDGGHSRVMVVLVRTSSSKTQISVLHSGLADADSADRMKAYWRERLTALKADLEG